MDPLPTVDPPSGPSSRHMLLAGALLASLLVATAVPGPFTIDEANHVAAIAGLGEPHLALPGTSSLPASPDLLFFDPSPTTRASAQPVVSVVPPLYAPLAWPFARFGYRGLVALNALAFVALLALVFRHVRRRTGEAAAAWAALVLVAAGCSLVDYAQALWPHALTVFLSTAAFVCVSRAMERADARFAAAAGALAGLAAGVRYQDVVLAALLGGGLFLFRARQVRVWLSYIAGFLPFVFANAVVNHARQGSWHPYSKAPGYARVPSLAEVVAPAGAAGGDGVPGPVRVLWAKVFDFRAHPPISLDPTGTSTWAPDAHGAFTWSGSVKLAWLQSSPWVLVALVCLVLAWRRPSGVGGASERAVRDDVRLASIVVAGMLAFFAFAGIHRHDGLSYNQRYLLELGPLSAIALALHWPAGTGLRPTWPAMLAGAGLAGVVTGFEPGEPMRAAWLLDVPLLLAVVTAAVVLVATRRARPAMAVAAVAVSVGWSGVVHLANDARGTRLHRAENAALYDRFSRVIPEGSALLAFGPASDAAGMLLVDRDVVVVDPIESEGRDTAAIVRALRGEGRRVLVDLGGFPPEVWARVREGSRVVVVERGAEPVVELVGE